MKGKIFAVIAAGVLVCLFWMGRPAGEPEWVKTELCFGLDRKGQTIPEREWQQFVDSNLGRRLKDGFTVLDGRGYYRGDDRVLITEPAKVVVVVHRKDPEFSRVVDSVCSEYCKRFEQQSVLKVVTEVIMDN